MGKHTQDNYWTEDEDRLVLRFANPNGRHKGFPNGKKDGKQDWHWMEKKFENAGYNRTWNMLRNRYQVICEGFERIDAGKKLRVDAFRRISALKADTQIASSNVLASCSSDVGEVYQGDYGGEFDNGKPSCLPPTVANYQWSYDCSAEGASLDEALAAFPLTEIPGLLEDVDPQLVEFADLLDRTDAMAMDFAELWDSEGSDDLSHSVEEFLGISAADYDVATAAPLNHLLDAELSRLGVEA